MTIDIETDDNLEYKFYPLNKKALSFRVKAHNDAHIALTSGPSDDLPIYEIFIGGWGNSKCALRRNKEKPDLATAETPAILTETEFKDFWVTWDDNSLKVGTNMDPDSVLLSWDEKVTFDITHFGICTGWGAKGSWVIDDAWGGWGLEESNEITAPDSTPAPAPPVLNETGPWNWVATSGSDMPPNAVVGGFDNGELYVGRAAFQGALLPGKVVPSHGCCYVSWGGEEHPVTDFEVLCDCQAEWVPSSEGAIPDGAVPGGVSEENETLYIGRVEHNDTKTVGKVHCSHKTCYIPYGGEEVGYSDYEVLVAN